MVNSLNKDINYIIVNYNKISEIDLSYFDIYYLPIVGNRSKTIYLDLIKKIGSDLESTPKNHYLYLAELEMTINDFLVSREKLEAVGLLESYSNNDLMVYILKAPLRPTEFFNNTSLAILLSQAVTKEEYEKIELDLFVNKTDYSKFNNNTRSLDDVYTIDVYEENSYSPLWKNLKTSYPSISHNHFDYERIILDIEPRDLYEKVVLRSSKCYEFLNSLAFSFNLDSSEIIKILLMSAKSDKDFDEKIIIKNAKKVFDKKIVNEPIEVDVKPSIKGDSETINILDSISANELVTSLYGKGLVSSEIEVLEQLHRKHGYSYGFINVLLIYVLSHSEGSFPSGNYFLKIANEWYRKGIKSTAEALNFIQTPSGDEKIKNNKKSSGKKPEWIDKHIKDSKEKVNKDTESESVESLKEFFK